MNLITLDGMVKLMPRAISTFVKEHKPTSATAAAKLADDCVCARNWSFIIPVEKSNNSSIQKI